MVVQIIFFRQFDAQKNHKLLNNVNPRVILIHDEITTHRQLNTFSYLDKQVNIHQHNEEKKS